MKRTIKFLTITAASAVLVFSCKRDFPVAAKTTGTGSSAYLLVVHASPNFDSIWRHSDTLNTYNNSLNIYVGADKFNAGVLQYGSVYPNIGNANGYAAVSAGALEIRLTLNGVSMTNPDSLTILSLQKTLVAGSYYTLVITDSIASTRDSSKIWLQDSYPNPTAGPGNFYLRFIHAVMDGIKDTVDLYSPRRNQVLFSKIKMDSTTPFINFSTMLNTQDTLYVRKTGTGTILARAQTLSFGDQQFYTVYYIGDTSVRVPAKTRSLGIGRNK